MLNNEEHVNIFSRENCASLTSNRLDMNVAVLFARITKVITMKNSVPRVRKLSFKVKFRKVTKAKHPKIIIIALSINEVLRAPKKFILLLL